MQRFNCCHFHFWLILISRLTTHSRIHIQSMCQNAQKTPHIHPPVCSSHSAMPACRCTCMWLFCNCEIFCQTYDCSFECIFVLANTFGRCAYNVLLACQFKKISTSNSVISNQIGSSVWCSRRHYEVINQYSNGMPFIHALCKIFQIHFGAIINCTGWIRIFGSLVHSREWWILRRCEWRRHRART